jgi:hypothetical protein
LQTIGAQEKMRIGQNPSKVKGSPAYAPARVGIAMLTYVPSMEGYFREALQVIEASLASLHHSLSQDCDIFVFDNGSCPEVLAFLQEKWQTGLIDWLLLSRHNLGKNGGLNWIFSAMPNEYIGYADSDVFFRPGWLESSLHIFDSFPQAGMVSSQPVFFDFLRGQGKTASQVAATEGLQVISVQPAVEILNEYCDGINASAEMRQQFSQQKLQVAVNTKNGQRAVTSATDMQFMLQREVARKLVPLPIAGALTGKDAIEIPRGIEALGYWLLSTEEPLVWHMGNSIGDMPNAEIQQVLNNSFQIQGGQAPLETKIISKGRVKAILKRQIARSPGFKKAVERLYTGLFSLLYEET